MTKERVDFIAKLLQQGTPLEPATIRELVEHAKATAAPAPSGEPMDLGVKDALVEVEAQALANRESAKAWRSAEARGIRVACVRTLEEALRALGVPYDD